VEQDPEIWLQALRQSHENLASILESLAPSELEEQSYDTEWSIAQVVSHLGSSGEIFELYLEAGLNGSEPPTREQYPAIWEAWNARTPQDQAAAALAQDRQLLERLESMTEDERDAFAVEMFGMPVNAAFFARMRLAEHALHTWDVEVSRDPSATLNSDAVALLIDDMERFAGRVGKAQGEDARVRIETVNPRRRFVLAEEDGQVTLEPLESDNRDPDLRLPAEALIRLLYGRLDPEHTPRVEARGIDLSSLRERFPGV
jgi:uncharacterized protein (TIGR03083 family)